MVKSILIICDQSPIGKNSASESIRLGTGLISLGDINCKVVFMGDAVYFLNKNLDPEAINMDPFSNIFRLMELSDLNLYVSDDALKMAGLERNDLIDYKNLAIINKKQLAEFILEADVSFRY